MANKIVRTICYFCRDANRKSVDKLYAYENILGKHGFITQTKRICTTGIKVKELDSFLRGKEILGCVGVLDNQSAIRQLPEFLRSGEIYFNRDVSDNLEPEDVEILFQIIKENAHKSFHFAYTFNNVNSSPYFPAANFESEGFSVGLQPTDLSENCNSLEEWFDQMEQTWNEILSIFDKDKDFLGIDSSIAPLFNGRSSLIHFIEILRGTFENSVTTDIYLKISNFIKKKNPKPIGLCGIMYPCLEDFELANEYEKGRFPVERNLFLALHSGLGIDTYPIGIDESPDRIYNLLCLVRELSNKYNKPLSARLVSDGKTKIGEKSDFNNQYLQDIVIRHI